MKLRNRLSDYGSETIDEAGEIYLFVQPSSQK